MANEGMRFRFRIEPFAVGGVVGDGIELEMTQRFMRIGSRAEFDNLIDTLQRLREEVSMVNCWEGEWNVSFSGMVKDTSDEEAQDDGVPVQDLAEERV